MTNGWIDIKDRTPPSGVNVLVFYKNSIVKAFYAEQYSIEEYVDSEYGEYDEETDKYYLREGWHESIDNWEEYSSVEVTEGDVTHWMKLPEPPVNRILK